PTDFGKAKFDLVYNQDSFPEMHPDYSIGYLRTARGVAPALLSINQESEGVQTAEARMPLVSDLVARAGGYRRVYRFPHWLRVGYVEELYSVDAGLQAQWQRVLCLLGTAR